MITKDSIETAYSFMHQKLRVYEHSTMEWQRDDIEYAISSYVDDMNKELYEQLSAGHEDYLRNHIRFEADMRDAVEKMELALGLYESR